MHNLTLNKSAPIGIFDSGIGGLTVASALVKHLPREDILYFGDTAHLPYGDKSEQSIITYATKISEFLLSREVKCIVIACNTASSVAHDLLQQQFGKRCLVINVIDPLVNAMRNQTTKTQLGLIGTRRTIQSQCYQTSFAKYDHSIKAHATPLLAAAIEEGFSGTKVMSSLLESYLKTPTLENIDKLILGCTHYPIVKSEIETFYQNHAKQPIEVIDPSHIIAQETKEILAGSNALNDQANGNITCYLSDLTSSFKQTANQFFQKPLEIEKYPLWD